MSFFPTSTAKLASLRRSVLMGLGLIAALGTVADAVVPFAPSATKVGVTRVDTGAVESQRYLVRWKDNSLNESYFIIQARAGTSGSFVTVSLASADAEVAGFQLNTMPVGTQMYFRVLAVNDPTTSLLLNGDEGISTPSPAVSVGIPNALTFGAPTAFAANVTGDGLVKLTWTDNSTTEEAFEVQYKVLSAGDDTYATLYNPAYEQNPFETSAGLAPGQSYALRIRALKGASTTTTGTSYSQQTAFSPAVSITIPTVAVPTNFTLTSIDEDTARLNWTDNSYNEGTFNKASTSDPDAGGYVILQRQAGSSDTFQELGNVGANVEEVSSLTVIPGLTLEWQVKARHRNGSTNFDSSASNTVTFTSPFKAPTELIAVYSGKSTTEGKSRYNVMWKDNSLVESGYAVEGRTGTSTTFDTLGSTSSNATRLTVDVPDGQNTELRVRAFYLYGGSPFYSAATTTVVVSAPNGFTSRTWHPAMKGSPITAYQATVGTSPALTSWELISGPAWLSFDSAIPDNSPTTEGQLTGTPTESGIQTATIRATFADGSTDTHVVTFRVQEPEAPPQQMNNPASFVVPVGMASIPLTELFRDLDSPSAVKVNTTVGDFPIILEDRLTPLTVANFMAYVNGGDYSGVAVHRAVPGFVVQMGGYKPTGDSSPDINFTPVTARPAVLNEPGIPNVRRTIAMAKQGGDPNSATHDFFVSLADNRSNLDVQNGSFTVFGRVPNAFMGVPDSLAGLVSTYNPPTTVEVTPADPEQGTPAVTATKPGDQYRVLLPAGTSTTTNVDFENWPLTGTNTNAIVATGTAAAAGSDGSTVSVSYDIRNIDKSKLVTVTSVSPEPTMSFSLAGNSNSGAVSAVVTGSTLNLEGLLDGESSSLTVTATDLDGNATNYSFTVNVDSMHEAVFFNNQPLSATIDAGDDHVFAIGVTGTDPVYQWRKNGVDIPGATGSTFTILNADIDDQATYQVVVTSPSNIILSDAVTLTVNSPPTITVEPADQSLKYGAAAVFSVEAKGSGTPTYQWRKNDTNISGATSATLTLPQIAMTDAGSYTCVVTNSYGSDTSAAATLTVIATDQDSDGLPDHEEIAQGTDRFDTDSDDDGYTDGMEVTYGSNPKSASSTPASTIVIAKVERINILRNIAMRQLPARTGFPNGLNGGAPVNIPAMWLSTYELTNAQWAAILQHAKDNMSSVITIVDNSGEKEIHSRGNMVCRLPTHKAADPGSLGVDEVKLSDDGTTFQVARAAADHPARGISWYGAYLAAEVMNSFFGYTTKMDTANLSFNFEISNGMGGFTPVNGFHVPRFYEWEHAARSGTLTQVYPTGAVISGTKANYDATAFGKPRPANAHVGNPVIGCFNLAGNVSEWIFEADVNTAGNGFTRGGGYGDPVTDLQNDAKKSRAKNVIEASVGVRLALVDPRAPTSPTSPAANFLVKTGSPITLSGNAVGAPPLLYQWYRDGKALSGQTKPSLNIPSATLADGGRYKLVIKNGLGSISTNESMVTVVESVARTIYVKLGSTATLTAKSKGSTNLQYQWRKDELPLANDELTTGVTTSKLKVFGPTIDSIAYYDCQITGPSGSGTVLTGETLVVFASKPIIAVPGTISPVVVGGSFSLNQNFSSSTNVAPTKWTITGLPPGMTYDPLTGVISGRATKAGVYTVKVTASNVAGSTGPIQYVIVVEEFPSGSVGDFVGSIAAGTSATDDLGGRVDLRTVAPGSFTGSVVFDGVRHPISGTLATDAITASSQASAAKSRVTLNIDRGTGQNPLQVALVLDPATNGLSGTVGPVISPATEPAETSKMAINGWRNVWGSSNPATTRSGKQNLRFSLPALALNDPDAPQGESHATLSVASSGGTTFSGRAADGSIILFSAHLGPNGQALLFQTPYGNKGSLLGTLAVAPTTQEVTGTVRWYKKNLGVASTDRNYKDGLGPFNLTADGRPYAAPAAGQIIAGFPNAADNAKVTFSPLKLNTGGTALEGSQNAIFRINTDHSTTLPAATTEINLLSLKITPSSGNFTGKVSLTDTLSSVTREANFTGLFVKNATSGQPGAGYGYLLLPHLPGDPDSPLLSVKVLIEKNP